jgi:HD-GYP domain-containing protein (c-di-GMP phosphodiesterase class II)
MTDTQGLVEKIAALRRRLEQMKGLVDEAGSAAASLEPSTSAGPGTAIGLEEKIGIIGWQGERLDASLRRLEEGEAERLPAQLTSRARRLVERARSLLEQLRALTREADSLASEVSPDDPAARLYREVAGMTEAVLRLLSTLPDAPSVQLRFTTGLDAVLDAATERVQQLTAFLDRRRRHAAWVQLLAEFLTALQRGQSPGQQGLTELAEAIHDEAAQAEPLRFLSAPPEQPEEFVACHGLVVAQVIARLIRHDGDWQRQPLEPILAALIHDAGMLAVPVEVIARSTALEDSERRAIEGHPGIGAEWAARAFPGEARLAEAVADHHERLDGTGYPSGLGDSQLSPLSRLLAVCDVYAALCSPRPYRPARETRTALTDTLLLAEQGLLDRFQAERLLRLSFYPVGSVVELADGAVGVVVATPPDRLDLMSPARPVVALLIDSQGRALPSVHHIDLAHCDGHSIVRALPAAEGRKVLARRYMDWAA